VKYLLDTHTWLWLAVEPDRISPSVLARFENPARALLVSVASAWEIVIKHQLGKLRLPEAPGRYMETRLQRYQATALPIELRHALQVSHLPLHHRDPFDRILVAQAQVERAVLVTTDRKLAPYDVEILWADEMAATDLHEPPAAYDAARPD